jgi:hypothetical protein
MAINCIISAEPPYSFTYLVRTLERINTTGYTKGGIAAMETSRSLEQKNDKSGITDLVSIMNNPRHEDDLTLPGPDYEGPDAREQKKASKL